MGEFRQQKHTQHAPSMRWNVTTSMVGLKNGDIRKNLTKNGDPRDKAGHAEEEVIAILAVVMIKVLIVIIPIVLLMTITQSFL